MASLDCPSCGVQSPRSAERCPECGLIFTPGIRRQAVSGADLGKPVRVLIVVALLAAGTLIVLKYQGRDRPAAVVAPPPDSGEGLEPAPTADDSARTTQAPARETQARQPTPAREPPAPPPARRVDTAPATPSQLPNRPQVQAGDTAPRRVPPAQLETPPAIDSSPTPVAEADSTPPGAALPSAPAFAAGGPLERFARTWVNLRDGRSGSAPTVRTLRPGERVLVDSLADGWYRVVVDGRTEGYVDRSYLDEVAPTQ